MGRPLAGLISPHQNEELESEMKSVVSGINSAPLMPTNPAWYIPELAKPDAELAPIDIGPCLWSFLGLPVLAPRLP